MRNLSILLILFFATRVSGQIIVTGSESGDYYKVGSAISNILADFQEQYQVESSEGSLENVIRLFRAIPVEEGKPKLRAQLAILQSDVIHRSKRGKLPESLKPFQDDINSDVRTLLALYPEYVQILIGENSEIDRAYQLAGKNLFTGAKASGSRLNSEDLLNFLKFHGNAEDGKKYNDILTVGDLREAHVANADFEALLKTALEENAISREESQPDWHAMAKERGDDLELDFLFATQLIKSGLLDAAFVTQGSIVKIDGLKHFSISDALISEFRSQHDWYGVRQVDVGMAEKKPTLFTRANLVALSHQASFGLPRESAEKITKLIYEGRFELATQVTSNLDFFVKDQMVRRVTDQLHSGARDYFLAENIIPRMTFSEWLLLIPLAVIFATIFLNFLHSRGLLGNILRSEWVARIYSPGSLVQRGWDWFYGVVCGSWLNSLAWMAAIVFAVVVYLIRITEKEYAVRMDIEDPFVGASFWDAAYWMLTFATTGFNQDIYPNTFWAKMLAVVVPLSGLGLTVFVLMKHTFKNDRRDEQRAQGLWIPKELKNHIVVCGWNDRVPNLLRDLTSASSPLKPGARVVVIAETDEEKPLEAAGIDKKKVSFLRGRSSDYDKLSKANITAAIGAIVVAGNRKVGDNNYRSILTCTAIRHTLRKSGVKDEDFPIIAELYYEKNKAYFEQSGVKKLVCIKTLAMRMISHAALNPGVSGLLLSLLRFSTEQCGRALPVDEVRLKEGTTVEGMGFWEALIKLRASGFLLLAVWRTDRDTNYPSLEVEFRAESPYHFCPSGEDAEYRIKKEDKLLIVTHNRKPEEKDIRFLRGGAAQRFEFQKERVLIIGNGWVGDEISEVLALRSKEVIQLVVSSQHSGDSDDFGWEEEKFGNVTVVKTRGRLDEDFYRQFADRLSQINRAVILGPDRKGREKQSEIFHDDETIMHAKALRRVANEVFESGRHFHILAEMRCIDNLELFHDSGIDQPVPTTSLVEECLVQMIFHRGVVSEFFLKAMSYSPKNNKGRLKRVALNTLEEDHKIEVIGKNFDQLLEECAKEGIQLLAIQKSGGEGAHDFPLVFNPKSKTAYLTCKGDYAFILGQSSGETEAEGKSIESECHEEYLSELNKLKFSLQFQFKDCNINSVEAGGAHVFVPPTEYSDFAEIICSPAKEKQALLNVCNVIHSVFKSSQNHVLKEVVEIVVGELEKGVSLDKAIEDVSENEDFSPPLIKAARAVLAGGFEKLFGLRDLLRVDEPKKWMDVPIPDAEHGDPEQWAKVHVTVLGKLLRSLEDLNANLEALPKLVKLGVGKVFVSCSSQDKPFVEGDLLPILTDLGADPWYYKGEISTGDYWQEELKEALSSCDWFLVVISENSAASEHVKDEIEWAIRERSGRIIPIVIDGCEPGTISLRLGRIQRASFRDDFEVGKEQLEKFFNKKEKPQN